jgi:transposase InsO family protein
LKPEIQRVFDDNYGVYGVRKVWVQLGREGFVVAKCTVRRLMRQMGLRGAIRGKAFTTTTIPDESLARPEDLVKRDFTATAPNVLWVTDLERHEAPLNRVVMKGHHGGPVAAGL